ncbi:hypothetical protein BH11ACT5_BH11ACT5_14990 [soil metagenome]
MEEFFGSARFASALTTTAIGTAVLSTALQRTIGWAGLIAMLSLLGVLAILSLIARRTYLEWQGLLPISLLVFLTWTALTLIWSQYKWATVIGLLYLGVFTLLGLTTALTRDTIQIVRAFGGVLRMVLGVSLALEIVAGALLDSPIGFLGIEGNLDQFGPLQGLLSTRNQLGLVALLGLITFGTEFRTKSFSRPAGIASMILAGLMLVLSGSPILFAVTLVVCAAAAALYGLRRVRPERRTFWQLALLAGVGILALMVWAARSRVIELFAAGDPLAYRLSVWQKVWSLIPQNPLEGWGWIGSWRSEVQPFPAFTATNGAVPGSALNAYLDVWFQLGLIGAVIFVGLLGLAFVRSWLLAGRRRSFVYAWPALILVALLATSLAESTILVSYGWMIFVVCCVKAARELSWRRAFETPAPSAELP